MKACTAALSTMLNNRQEFKSCSLFRFDLLDGTTIFCTDFDKDVVYDNHVFKADLFSVERDQTKLSGVPTVDTTSISIYADREHNDLVGNDFILEAIHKGAFDVAYLTLWRAYFDIEEDNTHDEKVTPYGAVRLFNGRLELTSCSSFKASFSAKSEVTGLNALLPVRTFQAQSSYRNVNGTVIEYSGDTTTCVVPLKPNNNVLYFTPK